MESENIVIRQFQAEDQEACKGLVLAGLEEHWGWLDPTLNPDLDDIGASFREGVFLTAWLGEDLVGTGGFTPAGEGTVQITRMSVRRDLRGQGLGRRILKALEDEVQRRGLRHIVLETTETWGEVVQFYLGCGYRTTHHRDGDVYFAKSL